MSWTFARRIALVLAASACAHGGRCPQPPPSVIEVSGSGSAMGTPDVAMLQLGVQVAAASVAEARQRAAQSMDAMLDALRKGGVADKDLQTARLAVEPQYRYVPERPPEVIGFQVTNTATVKIRAIDRAGQLIDAALKAGGNDARLDSLAFTIDDPSPLEAKARQEAVEAARKKAATLAAAAGVDLGPPISISEGGHGPPPIAYMERAMMARADAAPTPVQPGQLEVRIDVRVLFRLDAR